MKIKSFLLSPYKDVYTKSSSAGNSIAVLDGIRGLAVLVVLASHTNSFGMQAQGSLGVLLFYFLSGFVLTLPFIEKPEYIFDIRKIVQFFINRILRIAPIYIVIAGITALCLDRGFEWYIWNISFIKGWNHFWSVAEEARFYLLFPIVISLLALARYKALRIIILIALVFFAIKYKGMHKIDMMDGRKVSFYFFMFLGGCLSCYLVSWSILYKVFENFYIKRIMLIITLLIFIFIFLSSFYWFDHLWRPIFQGIPKKYAVNGWRFPNLWLALFIIFFFALTFYKEGIVHTILTSLFLKHFGLLSYSIYLVHMIFVIKFSKMGYSKESLFIIVLLSSYIVALFSYILIEKPFLSLKNKRIGKVNKKLKIVST